MITSFQNDWIAGQQMIILPYHTFVIIESTNCPKEWENRNFIFLGLARFASDNG